ncbi:uncharacterized protein LOC135703026 [Ochlerotatus camptorhynchus]|uniref:uncharacterized protein LOC135703026 n=1 Tax=Ochlerotatus camptorhynchus TaxID=644619 RepID=UPI0031DDA931
MDSGPRELSLAEIRSFMLKNNCKVTNHALVKHFRAFLTNKETQDEARKVFKSYVNTLASIKNEGDEKFLILRKKYINECPSEDAVNVNIPMSPGSRSLTAVLSDGENSPFKLPPPYRPPPEVLDLNNPYQGSPRGSIALSRKNSSDTGRSGSEYSFSSEFTGSDSRKIGSSLVRSESSDSRLLSEVSRKQSVELYRFDSQEESAPAIPPRKRTSVDQSTGQLRQFSIEEKNREPIANIPMTASESEHESNKENEQSTTVGDDNDIKNANAANAEQQEENKLSVKEKMMKFNRFASEEEAKVPSPIGKKKPEKSPDETLSSENLLQHPKAKEWLIAAANANYQELAKLSTDSPNLVKLQVSNVLMNKASYHRSVLVTDLPAYPANIK